MADTPPLPMPPKPATDPTPPEPAADQTAPPAESKKWYGNGKILAAIVTALILPLLIYLPIHFWGKNPPGSGLIRVIPPPALHNVEVTTNRAGGGTVIVEETYSIIGSNNTMQVDHPVNNININVNTDEPGPGMRVRTIEDDTVTNQAAQPSQPSYEGPVNHDTGPGITGARYIGPADPVGPPLTLNEGFDPGYDPNGGYAPWRIITTYPIGPIGCYGYGGYGYGGYGSYGGYQSSCYPAPYHYPTRHYESHYRSGIPSQPIYGHGRNPGGGWQRR